MSTVSVVQYQGSPQKMNVLQQQQQNNREVIILRKQPSLPPQQQQQPQVKDILVTNTARKKGTRSGEKVSQNPPPIAVARRNARERNRVKQVNNGFATLRQHIPNSIAAAFESSSGRGGNKKLSKVETLRMAVEYIRSLEDMLAGDDNDTSTSTSYVSSTPSSPALTTTVTMSYAYPSNDEDDLSQSSHYTRNYFYEDSENLDPIDDNILTTDIDLGHQDLSLLNSMHTTTGSLSPEMYSDSSLSPISLERSDRQIYIAAYNSPKLRISPELMTEIKSEPPVLSLENDTDLPVDSKENMIEVMAWWEQQQTRR